jgi:redox-sensitive bicupin YhaK (pirin superfamily)
MQYTERAFYVVTGAVDAAGTTIEHGEMAVVRPQAEVRIKAKERSTVMLLGGEPVGERFIEWNFVSSSKARIEQAKADWRAGRMQLPDADNAEFIPLPPENAPPNPMS